MSVKIEKIIIPTYPEPAREELPMFAENRVHQRTSGNPYPQKIVLEVNREEKINKEYTAIILENDYIRICILPELGGRIYSAYDKRTGYDFFYKNNVIKPALIGCLGSWISGGMEFNWPFHHRASTFMPVDYQIREEADGTSMVFLSEHDPIDHMKGMVCVILRKNSAYFETKARLYNRTETAKPFLWWENTAVPVNKDYQIFYPPDVSYVNFHYKRSVTTFPIADNSLGVFNGIRYEEPTDISMHKSTIQPTSYFCAPSEYDFFGGYDHSKKCGVVHIADHHISPGKKMFTWGYNQLSQSWENALTDSDGAYAELMAGVYSDNQPDFAWLEPFEAKEFSQYWYPIGEVGIPIFANLNGAIHKDVNGLKLQFTSDVAEYNIAINRNDDIIYSDVINLACGDIYSINNISVNTGDTISVTNKEGKSILEFTFFEKNEYDIPKLTEDLPQADSVMNADELYLEGVHVKQYRDPAIKPDYYWKKGLERNPNHTDCLLALGELAIEEFKFCEAKEYLYKAEKQITVFNKRPQSGKLYYLLALAELYSGNCKKAYDLFYKSSWNMDYCSASMTYIGALDIMNKEYDVAIKHLETANIYNARNTKAAAYKAIALAKLNCVAEAEKLVNEILDSDPLEHFVRFAGVVAGSINISDFNGILNSDPAQTILDIISDLKIAGLDREIKLIAGSVDNKISMLQLTLGNINAADNTALGNAFPCRKFEMDILKDAVSESNGTLDYYLGCLLYSKRMYEKAAEHFESAIAKQPNFYAPYRCLAAVNYSHLNKADSALKLLEKALELNPGDQQLIYEIALISTDPRYTVDLILSNKFNRDDIYIELSKAYNKLGEYDNALKVLNEHTFVACEGGEHAIADQYMFAHHAKGRGYLANGEFAQALAEFDSALTLPQNLGAGIWNEVKYVPHQYYKAVCLEKLGNIEEADKLYRHILKLQKDYFTEMHLKALPYYQAMVLEHFGEHLKARAIIDECYADWMNKRSFEDAGYFATTPFFISYCPNAKIARTACYNSLLGYAEIFKGNIDAAIKLFENGDDMYGKLFKN